MQASLVKGLDSIDCIDDKRWHRWQSMEARLDGGCLQESHQFFNGKPKCEMMKWGFAGNHEM